MLHPGCTVVLSCSAFAFNAPLGVCFCALRSLGSMARSQSSGDRSFAGALAARISKDQLLFTVQQRMAVRDIVDLGRRADDRLIQARRVIDPCRLSC